MTIEATTEARHTLPAGHYYSPEQYAIEQEQLWYEQWVYAGRAEQVAEPGQFFTVDIAGESVLITRNDDGSSAPSTTCAAIVGPCCATTPAVRPRPSSSARTTHGATTSNGALVATPRVEQDEVDRSALASSRCTSTTGRVSSSSTSAGDADPASRGARRRTTTRRFASRSTRWDASSRVHRTESVVAANWKILIENYNECLHCPIVHPELVEVVPDVQEGLDRRPEPDGRWRCVDHWWHELLR